jgi:Zn-dependent protease
MFGWSINLFRVRGIVISIHATFALLLAYFCWEGWNDGGLIGVALSVATFGIIFTSVLLHELGHSFTAMRFGVGVRGILLMPIGGMAQFDRIPRKPSEELLITAAGPAVNFAIVVVMRLFVGLPDGWDQSLGASPATDFCRIVLWGNFWLGIFNLYPAFPMDGGRILRALLAYRLPYMQATRWAVMIGRVFAVIGIAYSIYQGSYLRAVLFLFILSAGSAEYRFLRRQEEAEAQWQAALQRSATVPLVNRPPVIDP